MSTLLLSGWAQPADALAPLAPEGDMYDYTDHQTGEEAIAALAKFKGHERVIGWSLGGQLALRAIAAGTLAPRQLILIAAPAHFVGEDGMGAETFRLFRESYAKDPARTKARFNALIAKDDSHIKQVIAALSYHYDAENTARFLPWLDVLEVSDLGRLDLSGVPRTLILHGMNDRIVPYAQGKKLAALLPQANLRGFAGVGHAPQLSEPQQVRKEIAAWQ